MKRYYIALTALTLFILCVIAWTQYTRYKQFTSYHNIISEHTTHTVAGNIEELIPQKEHLMKLFLEHYEPSIRHIINDPNNPTRIDYLGDEIEEHFPNFFAFTITDNQGHPIIEDIESLVGKICLGELQEYASTGTNHQRIHPSPHTYHYDVMQPFNIDGDQFIFFLSFTADQLANILATSQAPSHKAALVLPQGDKQLLEVVTSGARNTVIRDSYILTADEQSRIIHSLDIKGTKWQVIDSYTPELYADFSNRLIVDTTIYLISYCIIISILFFYLLRTEKRKRIAERHKDEFLSIVSHELRTPLTAIMGSLGLARNVGKDDVEKSNRLLSIAYNHAQRLAVLVNDILDMQKIEAGKMEYVMQRLELNQLIHESIADISGYASERQCKVEFEESEPSFSINGDHSRLMQVMFNLLSNAIKYGKQGDNIQISITPLAEERIRIAITDHGEGIPAEFQSRLFEKFTQADISSTRSARGTGLGLSIVKRIIEAHGGVVGFHSTPGEGATFHFELPLAQ